MRNAIRNETAWPWPHCRHPRGRSRSSAEVAPGVTPPLGAGRLPVAERVEKLLLDALRNRLLRDLSDGLPGHPHLLQIRSTAVAAGDVLLEARAIARRQLPFE